MFLFAFSRDWLGADAMLTLQAATLAEAPGTALANTKSFDFDGWPAVVAPLNIAPESPLLLGRVVWQQGSKDQGLVVAEGQITPGGAHSEVEPNDSRETANPWPLGESMAGRITPVGDHDWYMIDVPQAGRLSVDLPPGSSKFGWPVSHVLTLEGARPDYADGDGSNHVELDVGKPGPVALLINANYDNEAADRLYRLTSKVDPAADADEAKDEAGRPLALGAAGTGAIFPAGDVDRFELKIDKPGQLVAVISAWPEQFGLEPNLTIVDLRKDIRAGSLELPIRIPMGEISNAGPIVVEFRDSYDDAANTAGYQIRFEVE
jgi:hypothetical protein